MPHGQKVKKIKVGQDLKKKKKTNTIKKLGLQCLRVPHEDFEVAALIPPQRWAPKGLVVGPERRDAGNRVWKGPRNDEEPNLWAASLGGGQVRGKNSPGLVRAWETGWQWECVFVC